MNTRDSYFFIRWLSQKENLKERDASLLMSLKRSVRERSKIRNERRIVKDDGIDGYIELVPLPANISTKEEAASYFEKEEYIVFVPGPHDCSGRKFTSWFKVFERRGRYFAYHRVSFDL